MLQVDFYFRVAMALALIILSVAVVTELVFASADHMIATIGFLDPIRTFGASFELLLPNILHKLLEV